MELEFEFFLLSSTLIISNKNVTEFCYELTKEVRIPPEVSEKKKTLSSEVERCRNDLTSSNVRLKETDQKMNRIYKYVHENITPVIETFNELIDTPRLQSSIEETE